MSHTGYYSSTFSFFPIRRFTPWRYWTFDVSRLGVIHSFLSFPFDQTGRPERPPARLKPETFV